MQLTELDNHANKWIVALNSNAQSASIPLLLTWSALALGAQFFDNNEHRVSIDEIFKHFYKEI